ncbi:MAG: multicopper oxidase family protein, partial [Candidatus Hydrogenedentes bacterium]|nr:multicopper oxidase family protein [Candidatus Hydrogenedentota bacterium]
MIISRRQFFRRGAGAVSLGAGLVLFQGCPSAGPLRTVRTRRSVDGLLDTALDVRYAWTRIGGALLRSRTYEGCIPGPTLEVRPGDTLRLRIANRLPGGAAMAKGVAMPHDFDTTNFHTHGLHVSPKGIADNPYRAFAPGTVHNVEIEVPGDHPAGTFFYHPHHHGSVTVQMMGGMAGALIVRGDIDDVPEIADAREHILVLQEVRIDENGETPLLDEHAFHGGTHATFPGSALYRTVNGQLNPTIDMRPGEVQRWRFVQAGIDHFTPLALDGHALHPIAMDGISFRKPEEVDSVLLAPGNRADVLVKAGTAGTYYLRKLGHNQGHGVIEEEILATVVVRGAAMDMPLPTGLPTPSSLEFIADDDIETTRAVSFSVGPPPPGQMVPVFAMNGNVFDPARIDEEVPLGAVEEWILSSATQDA